MKNLLVLSVFIFLSAYAFAQTDSLPQAAPGARPEIIAAGRLELLNAFLMNDLVGTGLWMDSLATLGDETYNGLLWDERWMLYYWTESYGTLLEEVSHFDENQRYLESWKIHPKNDSLFEWIDLRLNEKRFEYFSSIQNAFLNEEEKALATLLLEYLLRLNANEEEWAERLQAFEDRYPASRFLIFVQSIKPVTLKPTKKAFGISAGLLTGAWQGAIERSLGTPYMFNLDAYYWADRWNLMFDASFGGPAITRNLLIEKDVWPKDDPTNFLILNLNLGYDLANRTKIRISPFIGGGLSILKPPTPGEEEDPLPDYYSNFEFTAFHLCAALQADLKLFKKNYKNWNTPKGSYHGIRLKFGWNGLTLGKQNKDLKGAMLYFAVNYNFFAIVPK